jgi:hypothetical protein
MRIPISPTRVGLALTTDAAIGQQIGDRVARAIDDMLDDDD